MVFPEGKVFDLGKGDELGRNGFTEEVVGVGLEKDVSSGLGFLRPDLQHDGVAGVASSYGESTLLVNGQVNVLSLHRQKSRLTDLINHMGMGSMVQDSRWVGRLVFDLLYTAIVPVDGTNASIYKFQTLLSIELSSQDRLQVFERKPSFVTTLDNGPHVIKRCEALLVQGKIELIRTMTQQE